MRRLPFNTLPLSGRWFITALPITSSNTIHILIQPLLRMHDSPILILRHRHLNTLLLRPDPLNRVTSQGINPRLLLISLELLTMLLLISSLRLPKMLSDLHRHNMLHLSLPNPVQTRSSKCLLPELLRIPNLRH